MGYVDGKGLRFDWRNQRDADAVVGQREAWVEWGALVSYSSDFPVRRP